MSVSKTTCQEGKLLGHDNKRFLYKSIEVHTFCEFIQNGRKYFLVLRKFLHKPVSVTPLRVHME